MLSDILKSKIINSYCEKYYSAKSRTQTSCNPCETFIAIVFIVLSHIYGLIIEFQIKLMIALIEKNSMSAYWLVFSAESNQSGKC